MTLPNFHEFNPNIPPDYKIEGGFIIYYVNGIRVIEPISTYI